MFECEISNRIVKFRKVLDGFIYISVLFIVLVFIFFISYRIEDISGFDYGIIVYVNISFVELVRDGVF